MSIRIVLWLAILCFLLIDVSIGLPLIMGMDFHFGALGFITLASLSSPLGLPAAAGFVTVQIVVVTWLIRLNRG